LPKTSVKTLKAYVLHIKIFSNNALNIKLSGEVLAWLFCLEQGADLHMPS